MNLDEKLLEIYVEKSLVEKRAVYIIFAAFFGVIATIFTASSTNPFIQEHPILTIVLIMATISLTLLYLINMYREHKWNYQHITIRFILQELPNNPQINYEELIQLIENRTLFQKKNIKKILYKHYPPAGYVIIEKTPRLAIVAILILIILFLVTNLFSSTIPNFKL